MGVLKIQFCPKCGSLLRPSKEKTDKTVFKCTCGYKASVKGTQGYRVKFPIKHTEKDFIVVVEEDKEPKRKKREVDEDERQEMLELMLDHFPEE